MLNHIVQVGQRALQFPSVDRLGRFSCVFERDSEVGSARAGGLAAVDCGGCVADLSEEGRLVGWGRGFGGERGAFRWVGASGVCAQG